MTMTPNERVRKHREKQRRLGIAQKQKNNSFVVQWFSVYKDGLSCKVCGESCSVCLEFHHLDPNSKEGNISTMVTHFASVAQVLMEIAKCVVLCRNCHAKIIML
jgi:5-methylcytosine-specific restriction endonuclease McrA